MKSVIRATKVIVNLRAIAQNITQIRKLIGSKVKIMAVIKGDGYGHGAIEISKVALKNGADYIAVAIPEEGQLLRESGISSPILVLGLIMPEEAYKIAKFDLTQTVASAEVLKALADRYPFDNVLVAINAADKHYDPFIEKFLPTAVEKKIGIVGMKIPARDRIFANGGIITIKEAMEYVMTLPVSTIIIGIDDIPQLEENIKITQNFKPLTADQMLAIEDKTKPYYKELLFFKNLSEWPTEW